MTTPATSSILAEPDSLAERLSLVDAEVADAVSSAGRDAAEITRIVITKFHPASLVRQLHELGVRDFGENRHQDAAPKAASLTDLDATWHFVGQLQSKKVRGVLSYATVIHSLDRPSLIDALVAASAPAASDPIDVFLQLNLTEDPQRGGVAPAAVDELVDGVLAHTQLRLLGVMAVAPLGVAPRSAFATVREVSERVQRSAPHATSISMGMSADFRDAILEGATHLRIGTAITGKRPEPE